MRAIRSAIYFYLLLLITPIYLAAAQPEKKKWLNYEPTIVSLAGVLDYEKHFGPPGYGENKSDPAVMVPVLRLKAPINIKPKLHSQHSNEETDTGTFENIKTVQLIYPKKLPEKSTPITVTGTLMQAITGHHYTKVLLIVSKLKLEEKEK